MYRSRVIKEGTLVWRMLTTVTIQDVKENIEEVIRSVSDVDKNFQYIIELKDGRVLHAAKPNNGKLIGYHIIFDGSFKRDTFDYNIDHNEIKSAILVYFSKTYKKIIVEDCVPEAECNHELDGGIETAFAETGQVKIECLKCGKKIETKRFGNRTRITETFISNDLSIVGITDSFPRHEYLYTIPRKRFKFFRESFHMLANRMLKVYINGEEPSRSKYALINFEEDKMIIASASNYHIDKIKDVSFTYDESIYNKPYIVGVNIEAKINVD